MPPPQTTHKGSPHLLDSTDGVTTRYGKTEVDPRGEEELHVDLLPTLSLPHILHAVDPRRHDAGNSYRRAHC